jgi:hypothetical protein
LNTDAKRARDRAEAAFKKKEQQLREGQQAMAEYEAARAATREKTARLRALRLAPDAALKTPGPAAQTQPPDPWDPTRCPVHEYIARAGCSCACRSDT